jgi:hypothetical protein
MPTYEDIIKANLRGKECKVNWINLADDEVLYTVMFLMVVPPKRRQHSTQQYGEQGSIRVNIVIFFFIEIKVPITYSKNRHVSCIELHLLFSTALRIVKKVNRRVS